MSFGQPEKIHKPKADIRPALIQFCSEPNKVAWTAAGFMPAVDGLWVIGGMSELFRVGFSDLVVRGEAMGRWLVWSFIEKINSAFAAGCQHVVLSFDCAPPAEKWMEQVSRAPRKGVEPLEWDGESQLLHLDQPLPNWDSLMCNRRARFKMIQELMYHLSLPSERGRYALHDPKCALWLDYHKRLVELRTGMYCAYHPSTGLTEDDFGLHYWERRLGSTFTGPAVCLNSDTDCLTACLLMDPGPRRLVLIGAIDHATKGTDFVKYKHTDATEMRRQLSLAFPGRNMCELGLAVIAGGGDYVSGLPQISYRNLLRALSKMDPATTPLCEIDATNGSVQHVYDRSLEILACTALCIRVNDACKKGEAVNVSKTAMDPMHVLLQDMKAYGRKTYTSAMQTIYCCFPRHILNCTWYARYVATSILNKQVPSGVDMGGWVLDADGHCVYPSYERKRIEIAYGHHR